MKSNLLLVILIVLLANGALIFYWSVYLPTSLAARDEAERADILFQRLEKVWAEHEAAATQPVTALAADR